MKTEKIHKNKTIVFQSNKFISRTKREMDEKLMDTLNGIRNRCQVKQQEEEEVRNKLTKRH